MKFRAEPGVSFFFFCAGLVALLAAAKAWSGEARPWRAEWQKSVETAKKEGQVNVHVEFWGEVLDAGVFQKAYPEIKVVGVKGRGSEFQHRVMAERRADKYFVDVVSAGVTTTLTVLHAARALEPIRPALILPEVADESKWWQGKHHYVDPEREYVLAFIGTPLGLLYYNKNLVDPAEFKSLWDLLRPKRLCRNG